MDDEERQRRIRIVVTECDGIPLPTGAFEQPRLN